MSEYRTVRRWNSFFSHWYYTLEKKFTYKKWFSKKERVGWEYVAGNSLDQWEPDEWNEFNIVERITIEP